MKRVPIFKGASLSIEARMFNDNIRAAKEKGHEFEEVPYFTEKVGIPGESTHCGFCKLLTSRLLELPPGSSEANDVILSLSSYIPKDYQPTTLKLVK